MLDKILCWFGHHKWDFKVQSLPTEAIVTRTCLCCNKQQERAYTFDFDNIKVEL